MAILHTPMQPGKGPALFLFFLSGFAALVLEVVWMRHLSGIFGSTTWAVSTVLAGYMGGLALGAALLGRLSDRRALCGWRTYALLESGVGLYALLSPGLVNLVQAGYLTLHPVFSAIPAGSLFLRLVLALLFLLPPTMLMGGTLPVMVRSLTAGGADTQRSTAGLYGMNTLGAVAGVLVASFLLLPSIGLSASLRAAAAVNFLAAALALLLRHPAPETVIPATVPSPAPPGELDGPPRFFLAVVALAGGGSMACEVAWNRLLGPLAGNSVYAFGVILAAVLTGIGIGSLLSPKGRPGRDAARRFALLLLAAAAAIAGSLPILSNLAVVMIRFLSLGGQSFAVLQVSAFLLAAMVVFLPCALLGAAFPLAVRSVSQVTSQVAGDVGRVYAANTLGAVLGSLIGGFLLLPFTGTRGALLLVASLYCLSAVALLLKTREQRNVRPGESLLFAVSIVAFAAALVSGWDSRWMTFSLDDIKSIRNYHQLEVMVNHYEQRYYREGLNATVSVNHSIFNNTSMEINGRTNGSNNIRDMITQQLLGHLPLLLHPNPEDVLVIGMGTGVTLGAAAAHPVKSIECAEIEPAVIESISYFETENRNPLADPRVRVVVNDGRNHMLTSGRKYDVIISEPSHIWSAGVASLFTREHFQVCRDHLNEGGLLCQWFHTYQMSPLGMKTLLATFRSVFPEASLWFSRAGDIFIIGRNGGPPYRLEDLKRRYSSSPLIAADLKQYEIDRAETLVSCFIMEAEDLSAVTAGIQRLHTDDDPVLEFIAPRAALTSTKSNNFSGLQKLRSRFLPRFCDGHDLEKPDHFASMARAFAHKDMIQVAMEFYSMALERFILRPDLHAALAGLMMDRHMYYQAIPHLEKALDLEPERDQERVKLALAYARVQHRASAEVELARLSSSPRPQSKEVHGIMGDIYFDWGRFDNAARELKACLDVIAAGTEEVNSYARANVQSKQAYCLLKMGQASEAVTLLKKSVQEAPEHLLSWMSLGEALQTTGDHAGAVEALSRGRRLEPLHQRINLLLADNLIALGEKDAAGWVLNQLMEHFPWQTTALRRLDDLQRGIHPSGLFHVDTSDETPSIQPLENVDNE